MATLEQRGAGWRVAWRIGGKRDGARQSATFSPPPGTAPKDMARLSAVALKAAEAAKKLIEARGHRITRDEVLNAVYDKVTGPPPGMPTLAEWIDEWAKDRADSGEIQADTLTTYLQVLRIRVLPRLGGLHLGDIDEDVVKGWVRDLKAARVRPSKTSPQGRPISAQTMHRAHAILHQVLGAAVPLWIPRNPAARPAGTRRNPIGLPKVTPFEGMFLRPEEVAIIQAHCDPAIADLWFLLVRTGLRLGEALVLRVRDLMLDGPNPHIRVRRALKKDQTVGEPKSKASRRDVTISAVVVRMLRTRCVGRGPDDLVFPAPGGRYGKGRGEPWREGNLRRRHWLPALAAAQRCPEHPPPLPPKPKAGPRRKLRPDEVSTCDCPSRLKRAPRIHDGRHTHVSTLVEHDWSPKRVQKRVGHASYQTTMNIYGHLWEGGDGDRLDEVDRHLAMVSDEAE